MASPERLQELRSGNNALFQKALRDKELQPALEEGRNANVAAWDALLDEFEFDRYSDRSEFKVTQLLENLMEQSAPDAEKLLGLLANVVGNKYTDLRNRLLDIRSRLATVSTLSAFLPGPPEGGRRKTEKELEEEAMALRPEGHGRKPKHRQLAINTKAFAEANGGGDADSGP
jgi:hypothetical protein